MSKIMYLSLLSLVSLRITASENAWDTSACLSTTLRLEEEYVSTAAELYKHSRASEIINDHYNEQIIKDTQREYKKKDGKISEITTAEILTAIKDVKRNKQALLNEFTDSYSQIPKISKRVLRRFEKELDARMGVKGTNEYSAKEFTAIYEHGVAVGKQEEAAKGVFARIFGSK